MLVSTVVKSVNFLKLLTKGIYCFTPSKILWTTSNLPAYSGNNSHFFTLVAEACKKYLILNLNLGYDFI